MLEEHGTISIFVQLPNHTAMLEPVRSYQDLLTTKKSGKLPIRQAQELISNAKQALKPYREWWLWVLIGLGMVLYLARALV